MDSGESQQEEVNDGKFVIGVNETSFECVGEGEDSLISVPDSTSSLANKAGFRRGYSLRKSRRERSSLPFRSGNFGPTSRSSDPSSGRGSDLEGDEALGSEGEIDEDYEFDRKLRMLQSQVLALADRQMNSEADRLAYSKQENSNLTLRLRLLEENLRDLEIKSDHHLVEEQKCHRELLVRLDKDRQLELENCNIRLHHAEQQVRHYEEEVNKLKVQNERLQKERDHLQSEIEENREELREARVEIRQLQNHSSRRDADLFKEREHYQHIIQELTAQLEQARGLLERVEATVQSSVVQDQENLVTKIQDLEGELKRLKSENEDLKESCDELQGQLVSRCVQEGRELLSTSPSPVFESLAQELNQMDAQQLKQALSEQQEVNTQLRAYIDNLLLSVVEHYPQLLEKTFQPPLYKQ
ncbi:rab11 family-interacting protein 4B-like [Artemia franciscana]|uniref:FIP-RBD domain-containing protein n=1 Tax=Artemia franciscana TaxID=6661 RepID=A0AA88I9G3_ARTSF|nr:hypothetical protein QYM36_007523 [Artemia franciscana]KAK2726715.1 hypothetical protein QYM36_007523 [Artemia franciscana]KAK2726716.1 hypothetical protein QYM36_007523 [Artemia franciscana]